MPDGTLMLSSGNGSDAFLHTARRIGAGCYIFTLGVQPWGLHTDRKPDVIARTCSGLLYLYPGNGSGGWLQP